MRRELTDAVLDALIEGVEVHIKPAAYRNGITSMVVICARHVQGERALESIRVVQRDDMIAGYPHVLVVEVDYAVAEVLKALHDKDRLVPGRSATEPLRLVKQAGSEDA